ncbi:NAD(P)H nitroreductase [Paraglaciecola marina]|uniref:NAD(P)H nitroreductase n=1 Tax=Paraglaciecola marina TaxID=2500157 RepID=UPI0010605E79|nr:NAD(P)H nitroreductase [Paraglaciecola marina]
MKALDLLLNRRSQPRLQAPAPAGVVLENIKQAALRAPDHAALTPWQFIVCEGEGLVRLGELYKQAAIQSNKSEADIARATQLPLRAPMVIIAIAKYTEHAKVPWVEQVASASCGVHAMHLAAISQGFEGVWRTGSYAQDPIVKKALALTDKDEIVGFLYLGTSVLQPMQKPTLDSHDFFKSWN